MTVAVRTPGALAVVLGRLVWPAAALWALAWVLPTGPQFFVIVITSIFLSAAVHEAGHALAYWWVVARHHGLAPHSADTEVRLHSRYGLAMSIGTATVVQDRFVIAAGPLLPTVLGSVVLVTNLLLSGPFALTAAGAAFALHALGLLPGNDDGDRLWRLG